jgi:large subunit ribosomal protein L35
MPKIKTHSSSKKRFSFTGTGKIKRAKAFKRHILTKKTTKRTRNLRKSTIVSDANAPTVKMLIPYK